VGAGIIAPQPPLRRLRFPLCSFDGCLSSAKRFCLSGVLFRLGLAFARFLRETRGLLLFS
jgi:hypothetical protein